MVPFFGLLLENEHAIEKYDEFEFGPADMPPDMYGNEQEALLTTNIKDSRDTGKLNV